MDDLPFHFTRMAEARMRGILDGRMDTPVDDWEHSGLTCKCRKCRVEYVEGYAIGKNEHLFY